MSDCRVYVGNLPGDVREHEVEDIFHKYGRIRDLVIKGGRSGPAFAFVTFDDPRDADDAIYYRDGYDFAGGRIRVERPKSGGRFEDRDRGDRGGRGYTGRHSENRVEVLGIPEGTSWQDLKDFGREAGDVLFADVTGPDKGEIEYARADDVENAVKVLNGKKLRTHHDQSVEVEVISLLPGGGGGRGDGPRDDGPPPRDDGPPPRDDGPPPSRDDREDDRDYRRGDDDRREDDDRE